MFKHIRHILPILLLLVYNCSGQITPPKIEQYLKNEFSTSPAEKNYKVAVQWFYQKNNYKPVWINTYDQNRRRQLCNLFNNADWWAISNNDYTFCEIAESNKLTSTKDSILAEINYTINGLRFLKEISSGANISDFKYAGIKIDTDYESIAELFLNLITTGRLNDLPKIAAPRSKEYNKAINYYQTIAKRVQGNTIHDANITSKIINSNNKPLLNKLYLLGIADSTTINNNQLLQKVIAAKRLFNNPVNDAALIKQLNVPIEVRLKEMKSCINYTRWISAIKSQLLGIVNIPGTNFFAYKSDSLILYSKVIVGKPSTPTPTLTSSVAAIVVYPFWHVPKKIATKELLPSIKRDIGYLDRNNLQVLDKNGNIIDPHSIRWRSLSAGWFPYTLRQSTGCDNALGLLKFDFNNPFSVYLHDTPNKDAFSAKNRFLSHGCIRIESPVELARLLLNNETELLDSLTSQCLRNQSPQTIDLKTRMTIAVLYRTAWFNDKGEITFFDDKYKKLVYND